mgnify:CR=1 FL=1|tara:strand:- start:159 stop:416 length:258 start_codon:yes stop_codon:yes gene_type:complete
MELFLKGEENYHEFVKALITELTKNYDVVDLRSLAGQFTAKAHEKNQQQKPKKKKGNLGRGQVGEYLRALCFFCATIIIDFFSSS